MNLKRIAALMLVVFLALALTSCKKKDEPVNAATDAPVVTDAPAATDAPTAEPTATKKPSSGKNQAVDASELDMKAIIENKEYKGKGSVYHWWTAGGEKDAIEAIVDGF